MGGATQQLIPSWAVRWYLISVVILTYDFVFVMFRPGSSGNKLGSMLFSPMYLYAKYDKVFADRNDVILFYIYVIGFF